MRTVRGDGWPAVRAAVLERDGGCLATSYKAVGPAAATSPCRDRWGMTIPFDALPHLEMDHVTQNNVRYDDEAHLVAMCPGHHRGNGWRSDSRIHRELERMWLAKHYPEVWHADTTRYV